MCLLHFLVDKVLSSRDSVVVSSNGDDSVGCSFNHLFPIGNLNFGTALLLHFDNDLPAFANQGAHDRIGDLQGDSLLHPGTLWNARRCRWCGAVARTAVGPVLLRRWVRRIRGCAGLMAIFGLLMSVIRRHILVGTCLNSFLHEAEDQLASFDLLIFCAADGHGSLFNTGNPGTMDTISMNQRRLFELIMNLKVLCPLTTNELG